MPPKYTRKAGGARKTLRTTGKTIRSTGKSASSNRNPTPGVSRGITRRASARKSGLPSAVYKKRK
jgi:hypothetical protein